MEAIKVTERPKPALFIKPDTQVFREETVTFRCEIQDERDTEWRYDWYKDDNTLYPNHTTQEFNISWVPDSSRGKYTCRGRRHSDHQISETSDPVTLTVSEKPTPTVSVNPQRSIYTGDRVTLNCNLPSTGWSFSWYKGYQNSPEPQNTNPLSVIISNEGQTTYYCKALRGNYESEFSAAATVTVKEKPDPELTSDLKGAALTGNPVTLYCTLKLQSAGWKFYWMKDTQRRETETETHSYTISSVSVSDGGQYRCRAGRGNPVYYTHYSDALWVNVIDGNVILDSPVHPVTEGHLLTLRCLYRKTAAGVGFYKDDSFLQSKTTVDMTISSVSKSDEGFYHCEHPLSGESPKSWISVRVQPPGKPSVLKILSSLVVVSLYVLVTIILAVKCYRARTEPGEDIRPYRVIEADTSV
ncbi:Fc receptor-like protein 5 [Silurus asotus]|uniref:Fc receptor-like protein 5 n=1 Tax=Silurus asotus TaxID=30991 RepID=A0AAD5AZY3_SILAS|nr:Fc receptor-like protein 5 [Silurus asotus]